MIATAQPSRAGMVFHRDGSPARAVDVDEAVGLFSRMIDRVKQAGTVPVHLSWNGMPISVGRIDDGVSRLRVTVGAGAGQVEIPLREAWPPAAQRADLLRKLTQYIDGAGQRATRIRQRIDELSAPAPAVARPTAAASPALAAAPSSGAAMRPAGARKALGQAFPAPPTAGAAGGSSSAQSAAAPCADVTSRSRARSGRLR